MVVGGWVVIVNVPMGRLVALILWKALALFEVLVLLLGATISERFRIAFGTHYITSHLTTSHHIITPPHTHTPKPPHRRRKLRSCAAKTRRLRRSWRTSRRMSRARRARQPTWATPTTPTPSSQTCLSRDRRSPRARDDLSAPGVQFRFHPLPHPMLLVSWCFSSPSPPLLRCVCAFLVGPAGRVELSLRL